VFAKKYSGYRVMAKNIRFWSLLILLLSVASITRKLLKTTHMHTEERSVHKKTILFLTNSLDITTYRNRLFLDTFVYS